MLPQIEKANNIIDIVEFPRRIISLVPSQTELLSDLGLEKEVVGITKFCIHPQSWFKAKERIGGTKTVDLNKIRQLQPDLIIANKEENVKEQVILLESVAPVWISDIYNLSDALNMIRTVGSITGTLTKAMDIADAISRKFFFLEAVVKTKQQPLPGNEKENGADARAIRAAYLIWRKPYMAAGNNTFINDLMQRCGFLNLFSDLGRYPKITIEELQQRRCNLLLLSSEPYPFSQKHINEFQQQLPGTRILLVNGEMFSWYGSRLLYAAQYFTKLVNEIHANPLN